MGQTTKEAAMTRNLEQTTQAILVADEAHVREAIESVTWERRGLLQRLVRSGSETATGTPDGRRPGR
jgi:hypothetical protein